MDESEFRQRAEQEGYRPPATKDYPPQNDPALHAHEFSALVLVTSGELTMGYADGAVTLTPGEVCEVPAGTLHAERTGPGGATALLALR